MKVENRGGGWKQAVGVKKEWWAPKNKLWAQKTGGGHKKEAVGLKNGRWGLKSGW